MHVCVCACMCVVTTISTKSLQSSITLYNRIEMGRVVFSFYNNLTS